MNVIRTELLSHKRVDCNKFSLQNVEVSKQSEDRKTIQISATAHKALLSICDLRPIRRSMFDVASQLVEWFGKQPQVIQAAIANDTVEGLESAYAAALRALADDLDRKANAGRVADSVIEYKEPKPQSPKQGRAELPGGSKPSKQPAR